MTSTDTVESLAKLRAKVAKQRIEMLDTFQTIDGIVEEWMRTAKSRARQHTKRARRVYDETNTIADVFAFIDKTKAMFKPLHTMNLNKRHAEFADYADRPFNGVPTDICIMFEDMVRPKIDRAKLPVPYGYDDLCEEMLANRIVKYNGDDDENARCAVCNGFLLGADVVYDNTAVHAMCFFGVLHAITE